MDKTDCHRSSHPHDPPSSPSTSSTITTSKRSTFLYHTTLIIFHILTQIHSSNAQTKSNNNYNNHYYSNNPPHHDPSPLSYSSLNSNNKNSFYFSENSDSQNFNNNNNHKRHHGIGARLKHSAFEMNLANYADDSDSSRRSSSSVALKVGLENDVIFGGLFPMHERGDGGAATCGRIKREKGIQRLEAMLYAVDLINNDDSLLPGLNIGLNVLDTCSDDTYALEQCMDFIKAQLQLSSFDVEDYKCRNGSTPRYRRLKPVAGVIGAASSPVSIMVAYILRLFKIPQISYASTSADLSDKSRFGYFSRVVPSDTYQAQAMADIAHALGWTFVNTLADSGTYGEKGIQAFIDITKNSGLCVSRSETIDRGADDATLLSIVQSLLKFDNNAQAILMFVNEDNSRKVIKALKKLNMSDQVFLLASDSWGAKVHPVYQQEAEAEGTVTILPKRSVIPGFDRYFLNLNLTNTRNPWFKEFWADIFNCSIDGFGASRKKCTGRERLRDWSGYRQEGLVQFVIDSVYAMAHAVHDILTEHCQVNTFQRCPALKRLNGPEFLEYIRNVSFEGISGDMVGFNKDGDSLGRYDIYQFQRMTSSNTFAYVKVGEWIDSLYLNTSALRWKNLSTTLPVSKCSQPCGFGEKKMTKNSECCWMCIPCKDNEYMTDATTCKACPDNHRPNATLTGCESLPIISLMPASLWFILPVTFSMAGVMCTIFVFGVFIAFNKTPIIMASGRELCYILLLGIALSYITSIVMLVRPTAASCAVQRLGLGVSLCFVYAAILTKTNRIFRIFSVGIKAMVKRPSYTSPKSQILICTALVSLQVVGGFTWLGFEKPDVKLVLYQKNTLVLKCQASQIATLVSLFYNIILIILCTVYAFKTRKIPQNFNEAKYIAFTMYSTCIVWLAFVTIYFGANHDFKIEITSLCMCVNISATVALFCLFTPKIYIVLLQPHKNVRQTANTNLSNSNKTSRSFYDAARSTAGIITSATTAAAATGESCTYVNNGGVYCGEVATEECHPYQAYREERKRSGSHVITSFTTVATEAPRESSYNEDEFDTIDDIKEEEDEKGEGGGGRGGGGVEDDSENLELGNNNINNTNNDDTDFVIWEKRADFDQRTGYEQLDGNECEYGEDCVGKFRDVNNHDPTRVSSDEMNGVYNNDYSQKLREIMNLSKSLHTPPTNEFEEYDDSSCDETSPVKINRMDIT